MATENQPLAHHPPKDDHSTTKNTLSLSTTLLHADASIPGFPDVAPPLHISTTYAYNSNPTKLIPVSEASHDYSSHNHIYSRESSSTPTRLETVLSSILAGQSITYASGLAALHSAYVLLNPKRVAITGGYHGAHAILSLHSRLSGLKVISLDNARNPIGELEDSGIGQGDVIHIETPTNPSGTCTSIAKYAEIAKERNAVLLVDATFAPPPLQNPFDHGADIVMHSGTKYLGGHSDALCGVLATRRQKWVDRLRSDRAVLGNMMGNLEAWLVLRSLRTLEIRVRQQSSSAGMLVSWLQESLTSSPSSGSIIPSVIQSITHASLQHQDRQTWLDKQMPEGFGPVFSIFFQKEEMAKTWPSKLKLFTHATSLGGVESLVEWRRMSDRTVDGRIVRVSVGLEAWNDLRDDMLSGFQEIVGLAEGKNGAKDKSKAGDDEKVKEGVEGTAKMDRVEMEGDEEVKRKIEEVMHEVDLAMEDEGKNIVRENGKLSADEEKGKVEVNRDDRAEPEKVEDREVKIQEEEVKKGDTQAAGNEIKGQ